MHFRMNFFILFLSAWAYGTQAFCLTTPNISANALFLYRNSNFHKEDADPTNLDDKPNGLNVREMELQVSSDVDPYTRLNLLFSISPGYEANGTSVEETWALEPEEAFAESNVVPGVLFKLGKFKAFMGKHNLLHTHAAPFIEAPLANASLLGEEGLNDAGLSAGILLPAPWFSELTLEYLRGKGENEEFHSPTPGEGVGLAHWKNLFDLSDDLTVEIGVSYAQGENSYRETTSLSGADWTLKWRPSEGGRYRSLVWSIEYLGRHQSQPGVPQEKGSGVTTWLQYQFAERWASLYRYDTLSMKDSFDPLSLPNETWQRHSLAVVFSPSEFSSFKLEADQRTGGPKNAKGDGVERSLFLQANFTIGAHAAHAY